jgi:hypothetical protein
MEAESHGLTIRETANVKRERPIFEPTNYLSYSLTSFGNLSRLSREQWAKFDARKAGIDLNVQKPVLPLSTLSPVLTC